MSDKATEPDDPAAPASVADDQGNPVLFGVETGGHEDARPSLAWTAPDVLQVTMPRPFYLKVSMRRFAGIRVKLRFASDDPNREGCLAAPI